MMIEKGYRGLAYYKDKIVNVVGEWPEWFWIVWEGHPHAEHVKPEELRVIREDSSCV